MIGLNSYQRMNAEVDNFLKIKGMSDLIGGKIMLKKIEHISESIIKRYGLNEVTRKVI